MTETNYTHTGHTKRVKRASSATGLARTLLLFACAEADHKKPETRFSKDQFMDECICSRRQTLKALRYLKGEGSLVPIRGTGGGYHVATTYSLNIVGQGGKTSIKQPGRGDDLTGERGKYFRAVRRKYGAKAAIEMTAEKFRGETGEKFPDEEFDAIKQYESYGDAVTAKRRYEEK